MLLLAALTEVHTGVESELQELKGQMAELQTVLRGLQGISLSASIAADKSGNDRFLFEEMISHPPHLDAKVSLFGAEKKRRGSRVSQDTSAELAVEESTKQDVVLLLEVPPRYLSLLRYLQDNPPAGTGRA